MDLHNKERLLMEKGDDIFRLKKQVIRIKEAVTEENDENRRLLGQIQEQFHQHEKAHQLEGALEDWNRESRNNLKQLDERQYELMLEERKNQEYLEEVLYEKRKLVVKEEELDEY